MTRRRRRNDDLSLAKRIESFLEWDTYWDFQERSGSVAPATNVATALGRDIVINGGFDADTDWTKQAGWTINGGKAHANIVGGQFLFQTGGVLFNVDGVVGTTWEVSYEISNYTSGKVRVLLGASDGTTLQGSDGTHVENVTITGGSINRPTFEGQGGIGFVGSVDNLIVRQKDILASTVYPGSEELDESGASGTATAANWTTAWTVSNPSTGILRVTGDGVGNAYAWQTPPLTPGKRYRLQGQARSDGNSTPEMAEDPWAPLFTGAINTDWQNIDITYTATGTGLRVNADNGATTFYSEFRNLSIIEANPLDGDHTGVLLGQSGNNKMVMIEDDGATSYTDGSSVEFNSKLDPTQFSAAIFVQKDTWDTTERYFLSYIVDAGNWIKIGGTTTEGQLVWEFRAGGTTEQVFLATGSPADVLLLGISVKAGVMKAWHNGAQTGGDQAVAGTFVGNFDTMVWGADDDGPAKVNLGKRSYAEHYSDELTPSQWLRLYNEGV